MSPDGHGALADPMEPIPHTISALKPETTDVFTMSLTPTSGIHSFDFRPGQFNMLYPFGKGEVAISISGNPARRTPVLHTVRAVGSVTREIAKLRKGDVIGVRGPFGSSWPVEAAEGDDLVIVAGGLGLAPLRPVIYHALDHRDRYGRLCILYGARQPDDMLFVEQLMRWRGRFDVEVEATVDVSSQDWQGNVGVVTNLIRRARFDPAHTSAFVCGSEIMMRFTVRELTEEGVPGNRISVSMERNMRCAIGLCGHCQIVPHFVCKDGPVFQYSDVRRWFAAKEV